MATFIDNRRVEFHQTDLAGIVHFSEYFRFMESAEHAFFRSLGLSVHMKLDSGRKIGWPRVACSFEFFHPLKFEEAFEVHLSIDHLGDSSIRFVATICRGETSIASGTSTSVCCVTSESGGVEKITIPDSIRHALSDYM